MAFEGRSDAQRRKLRKKVCCSEGDAQESSDPPKNVLQDREVRSAVVVGWGVISQGQNGKYGQRLREEETAGKDIRTAPHLEIGVGDDLGVIIAACT